MDKFPEDFGSNYPDQEHHNNSLDIDNEEDNRSDIEKTIEAAQGATKQAIKDSAKAVIKNAVLSSKKAAVKAIGSALSALLAWVAPILVPVLIIVICILLILAPTAYAYMHFVGAFDKLKDSFLKFSTSVQVAAEEWFTLGNEALDDKAEHYEDYILKRFKDLNNKLIEGKIEGTDAADMKDLAVFWVYGKIYNEYFKPSIAAVFLTLVGQNPESMAPILKPLDDTVADIYTPISGLNIEDSRKQTHGDSINLYDIAAFDYVAGTLFDLMDLDLEIALNELIKENQNEITKEENKQKLEIYQQYGGKLIYNWGYHLDNLTNYKGVGLGLTSKDIAIPSVLQKNNNKANALYNFLMEAQSYSSSKDIAYLREKLLQLEQKNYSDGCSEDVLGKAIFTKVTDYDKIASLSKELDNMYLSYVLSLCTNEEDITKLKQSTTDVLKKYPFNKYVTDDAKAIGDKIKNIHVDTITEFTQADIEAKLEKMVKDLKLSRTQQAALTYKEYLTELGIATFIEYYSVNLQSELFDKIGKIADYTAANPNASKYIIKKAKGKSPSPNTLFKDNISDMEEIKNSFIIDANKNPVVLAINGLSKVNHFDGHVNKFIEIVNEKLNDNIKALENYKILYQSVSSNDGSINKNTDEYKEVMNSLESDCWEELEDGVDGFTSNAWFKYWHAYNITGNNLNGAIIADFRGDINNHTTNSLIWKNVVNSYHFHAKTTDSTVVTENQKKYFADFYTDVLILTEPGNYLKPNCKTFKDIRAEYDAYIDIFHNNMSTINSFRSLETDKSKDVDKLIIDILVHIELEIKRIQELQKQLLELGNQTSAEASCYTTADLSSFYKPGQPDKHKLEAGDYSDGVNTLNIMTFLYTQEEAIKKTIQKHYGDILKLYKNGTLGGGGNALSGGNVTFTGELPEEVAATLGTDYQKEFVSRVMIPFMKNYYEHGILPSVGIAQSIRESGWGALGPGGETNKKVKEHNNILGVTTGNYTHFDSWEECIAYYGYFLHDDRYTSLGLFEADNYVDQVHAIAMGGYCDDPAPEIYEQLILDHIESYKLYIFDDIVKGSNGFNSGSGDADGVSYHKDGALVLWREYYTNNLTFANLDKWVSDMSNFLNKPLLEHIVDKTSFSTHIINAINNIDTTLQSELLTVGITSDELKNIVAATLNAGLYKPKHRDDFTLKPGFKVTTATKKNADAIVKAIAKDYINIYTELGSKDKGFAIYLYVVDDRDLARLEIQNETGTFAEFVKKVSSEASESFTNINPNFVKVAQIISGDINVDVKDFYKLMNISNNTAGGSSNSTISNPIDLFYQDWLDAKYTMHDMYNTMNEEMDNKYERLPTYEEVLNDKNNLNQGSNIEGILTIEGPNGVYYSFNITKKFLTNNVDESLSLSSPQYIVIHDTGNKSSSADANEIYKTMNSAGATETMHYIVDSKGAYHTIRDNLMANHINDSATSTGGTRPEISNSNSLGVQFTVNSSGDKKKTFWHTVAITKYLMEKYTITDYNNVVLHNDVTGANDSQYMLAKDKEKWIEFKDALQKSTIKFEQYTNGLTANDIALAAVAKALEQLGKPYEWGATGPNSFDCSGLVQYAYANNSVQPISIPRTTHTQVKAGRLIFDKYKGDTFSLGDLLPGDLIFRGGSSPTHVLMYTGNGNAVHAPETGDVVKEVSKFGDVTHVVRIVEGVSNGGGGKLQFFSQTDSRWANFTYYRPGKTIRGSGCGVTSMAMIINAFDADKSAFDTNKDGIVTPDEMATYAMKIHAYAEGHGTDGSILTPAVAKASGLTYYSYTRSIPELKEHLRKGRLALGSYSNGLWTSGGHLIAVVGIDSSGRAIVYDPAIPTLDGSATAAGQPPRYNGPQTDTNLSSGLNTFYIIGK